MNNTVSYVCSLSKQIRAACELTKTDLKPTIENLVLEIENNAEIASSLRDTPKPENSKVMRQVDLRIDDKVVLKCFITWDHNFMRWHVFAEGAEENCFENQEPN